MDKTPTPWWHDDAKRNAWLAEAAAFTAELSRKPCPVQGCYAGPERRSEPRGFVYFVATGATLSEVREACPTNKS